MPFELKTVGEQEHLMLAGNLGVRQARSLWDALQPALRAGHPIQLQAEKLDAMDTSIIQILLLLSSRGRLQVGASSPGFVSAVKARGLEAFFLPSPSLTVAPPPELPPQILAKAARQGHG